MLLGLTNAVSGRRPTMASIFRPEICCFEFKPPSAAGMLIICFSRSSLLAKARAPRKPVVHPAHLIRCPEIRLASEGMASIARCGYETISPSDDGEDENIRHVGAAGMALPVTVTLSVRPEERALIVGWCGRG